MRATRRKLSPADRYARDPFPRVASHLRSPAASRFAPGFSFVEVLFAVMILGIGFIMIAAIFPVAIQQVQNASDESVSAAVAWNAMTVIQQRFSETELPPAGAPESPSTDGAPFQEDYYPGVVRSFRDPQAGPAVASLLKGQGTNRWIGRTSQSAGKEVTFAQPRDYLWNRIKGSSTVVDDRRFAWVAFYSRHIREQTSDDGAAYAQVVIVVARSRETAAYGAGDFAGGVLANLQPRPVTFDVTSDGAGPAVDQVVTIKGGAADAVVEGAYLIIGHDNQPYSAGQFPAPQGFMNGHVLRVGNRVDDNTWELMPGADFVPRTVGVTPITGLTGAAGYVLGKTRGAGGVFEGVAQDVAVYSMIIPVH